VNNFDYAFLGKFSFLIMVVLLLFMQSINNQVLNHAAISVRNDVVYLSPALCTYKAMSLGNGQLGVMLGNEDGLKYLFNHGSFFSSSDEAHNLMSSGKFSILLPETLQKSVVPERLALYDAKITTRYKLGNDSLVVSSWMAEWSDLIVVDLDSNKSIPDIALELSAWDRTDTSLITSGGFGEIVDLKVRSGKGINEIYLSSLDSGAKRATSMSVWLVDEKGSNIQTTGLRSLMQIAGSKRNKITLYVSCPVILGKILTLEDAKKESKI
jgi:hypothetical protein